MESEAQPFPSWCSFLPSWVVRGFSCWGRSHWKDFLCSLLQSGCRPSLLSGSFRQLQARGVACANMHDCFSTEVSSAETWRCLLCAVWSCSLESLRRLWANGPAVHRVGSNSCRNNAAIALLRSTAGFLAGLQTCKFVLDSLIPASACQVWIALQ